MADDDLIVIHPTLKRKVSSGGTVKFAMEVRSEALVINLDTKAMGDVVSQAIATELRERVEGITQDAAPATIKARESERKAYAAGKPWAVKRFSGGKMGATPPTTSTKAFNNSGRFAKSIVAGAAKGGVWIVNWAANRIDPSTGNAERIWNRLVSLVPAFADVSILYSSPKIIDAIGAGLDSMIAKAAASGDQISAARAKAIAAEARAKAIAQVLARAVLAAI